MIKRLIDVSEHQGRIDWKRVKPRIDGAILRCGYGSDHVHQDDTQFRRNADACSSLGIPFGVYLYSYADNTDRAASEAEHALRLVRDYALSYPVYLDLEQAGTQQGAVERARVFGSIIEKAGCWCGVYANLNWWENHLVGLEEYTKWVAQYYKRCEYTGAHLDIWQYTSKGIVDGIEGVVDLNECYRDLPGEITGGKTEPASKRLSVDELAGQVLDGAWGNGTERRQRLTAAGYDYELVQAKVNRIVEQRNLESVATAVIRGDYGNGDERVRKLRAAGYDPKAVQALVNRRLSG